MGVSNGSINMTLAQFLPIHDHHRLKKKAFTYNVTTPAAGRPLTLAEVKDYLKVTSSDEDDFINFLIDAATACGEKYTGRDFINKTYTTFRDTFWDCFELRRSRVSDVISIKFLLNDVLTDVPTTVFGFTDVNDYSEIFLKEDQVWPTDEDNVPQAIEIVFVAGFGADDTSIPADVQNAMLAHIAFMFENRGDCPPGTSALPTTTKILYDKLRIINIGSC